MGRFDVAHVDGVTWRFSVTCSSGTYVRSLVDDLGRSVGSGAHLVSLRRTRVGRFTLDRATALDAFSADRDAASALLAPPLAMVEHLGVVDLDATDAAAFLHGRVPAATAPGHDGEIAVRDAGGSLMGVATVDRRGSLHPAVVLADAVANVER